MRLPTLRKCSKIGSIQGDHSACGEPPVDFKTKVPFWPALAWPGQSGTFVLKSTGVLNKWNGHPVYLHPCCLVAVHFELIRCPLPVCHSFLLEIIDYLFAETAFTNICIDSQDYHILLFVSNPIMTPPFY